MCRAVGWWRRDDQGAPVIRKLAATVQEQLTRVRFCEERSSLVEVAGLLLFVSMKWLVWSRGIGV